MPERRKIKSSDAAKVATAKKKGAEAIEPHAEPETVPKDDGKRDKAKPDKAKPDKAKPAKARSPKGKASGAFDIRMPDLPDAVEAAAFESGGYPYPERYKRKKYEAKITPLQIELLKMLDWARQKGERIVLVFEGRDGAGKGGTIARFTQHMPPRHARIVALSKPSDTEKGQWYFQRYVAQMPTRGEIVFFDRSWYNRAGVERAMEFCSPEETDEFLREAPILEGMLARDGIRMIKLFFSIGREMQMKRLHDRYHDPLKTWKLSPIDFEAVPRFDAYSQAFNTMLGRTHAERAPWTVIRSNDKLRARLNAIRHVLLHVPYEGRDLEAIGEIDGRVVMGATDYLEEGGER